MKEIKIPKEIQGCVTIELFQEFLLGKTVEERLTPGIKETLQEMSDFFLKGLNNIADKDKNKPFFSKEEWHLVARNDYDYIMPPGYYVKIEGFVHLVIPSFEK